MSYNSPQTPSGQILGGGENYYFCPLNKKFVWGISRGKFIFVGPPEHRNLCQGGFPGGELISVSPPNIEIGVRGDLDYSPGQYLLV